MKLTEQKLRELIREELKGLSVKEARTGGSEYITDEFKVGDTIKLLKYDWKVVEVNFKPGKSYKDSFTFMDDKQLAIKSPPTNKNAVGYKIEDGKDSAFLHYYKASSGKTIMKLAIKGFNESVTEAKFVKALLHLEDNTGKRLFSEGKLTEAVAVTDNLIMKMKPGSTIKIKGVLLTKDKYGNWRSEKDPNDILVNRQIAKIAKGMKAHKAGNLHIIEGKLTEASKLSFRDAGISDLMDLKNATDLLAKSNIDWDQKGQSFVFTNTNDAKKAKQILGLDESKLNEEGAIDIFTKDMNDEGTTADIFDAVGDGKTVKGQFTKKKWNDGVPVTKHLSRGGYNDIKTPKGKFQLIESPTFWYYEINNGWAAINKSEYGTPPFEY